MASSSNSAHIQSLNFFKQGITPSPHMLLAFFAISFLNNETINYPLRNLGIILNTFQSYERFFEFPFLLVAQRVKRLLAMETLVQSPGQEEPLEKEMATIPILLPGQLHGQKSLVGYRLWDLKESHTIKRSFQLKIFYNNLIKSLSILCAKSYSYLAFLLTPHSHCPNPYQ